MFEADGSRSAQAVVVVRSEIRQMPGDCADACEAADNVRCDVGSCRFGSGAHSCRPPAEIEGKVVPAPERPTHHDREVAAGVGVGGLHDVDEKLPDACAFSRLSKWARTYFVCASLLASSQWKLEASSKMHKAMMNDRTGGQFPLIAAASSGPLAAVGAA